MRDKILLKDYNLHTKLSEPEVRHQNDTVLTSKYKIHLHFKRNLKTIVQQLPNLKKLQKVTDP